MEEEQGRLVVSVEGAVYSDRRLVVSVEAATQFVLGKKVTWELQLEHHLWKVVVLLLMLLLVVVERGKMSGQSTIGESSKVSG